MESLGLAMIIAKIFTYTISTNEFIEYIRKMLKDIVSSKEFITKLNQKDQKNLLGMVLKPKEEVSNVYSGINDYFNQYVEDSLELFAENYRSSMVLDAVASINKQKNCLQIRFDANYRVYKFDKDKNFVPLTLGFEDERFEHIRTIIRAQGNLEKEIPEDLIEEITDQNQINDPVIKKLYRMEVPEEFKKFNQINVSRRIIEYGNDHWQVLSYKTIKACDRMSVTLRCEKGLVIRKCLTYGVEDRFVIEKEDRLVKVDYNDWLRPGFGVNILIALDDFHKNESTNTVSPEFLPPDIR
ncbi:MAG: hypothetical protein GTO02_19615 [Candidatus Dadabacteria bacterium]|nr:hypothetical protein [Candidatus Dadabacteria bacterium]NIQ16516.1 hypothetical protein [Candidatus Dadabacteria bacterium]